MTTRGKVSTLSIQYLAGFFDADGGINIYQKKKGVKKDRIGYCLTINFTNTDKKFIDMLVKQFNGYVNVRKRNTDKHKTGYEWKLSANQGLNLLIKMYPFLVVKKKRAEIAIEFQELQKSKKYQFARNPKEVDDFYEICYQKMRILNKKGKKAYYPQRLNEKALKREATVRAALKDAEIGRNDLSALQDLKKNQKQGGAAVLEKYGRKHFVEMRSKVKK